MARQSELTACEDLLRNKEYSYCNMKSFTIMKALTDWAKHITFLIPVKWSPFLISSEFVK